MGEAEDLAEAEASALADRLGSEERLEDARSSTSGAMPQPVSATLILTYSPARTSPTSLAAQGHIRGARCASGPRRGHRVAGIDREVDDGVLKLVRVDVSRPGAGARARHRCGCARQACGREGRSFRGSSSTGSTRSGSRGSDRANDSRRRVRGGGAGGAFHRIVEVHHHLATRAIAGGGEQGRCRRRRRRACC